MRKGKKRWGKRVTAMIAVLLFTSVLISGFPSDPNKALADGNVLPDGVAAPQGTDGREAIPVNAVPGNPVIDESVAPTVEPRIGQETEAGNDFKTIVTGKGFSVNDVTDEFGDDTVVCAYWISNQRYDIEYYEYIDVANANETFSLNVDFAKETISESTESSVADPAHGFALFETAEKCVFMAYKNTVYLYTEVTPEYRDEVSLLFEELGYK